MNPYPNSSFKGEEDDYVDPMEAQIQKSIISSIRNEARASLNEPSRPFTPVLPRHLFAGNDYSNRPGSAYNVKNLIGRTINQLEEAGKQAVIRGPKPRGDSLDQRASRATTTSTKQGQNKGDQMLQEAILAGQFDIENHGVLKGEIKIDSKKPIKPVALPETLPRNLENITLAPISQNARQKKSERKEPLKKKKSMRLSQGSGEAFVKKNNERAEEEREDPDQDLEEYFEANLMKDSEIMQDIDQSLDQYVVMMDKLKEIQENEMNFEEETKEPKIEKSERQLETDELEAQLMQDLEKQVCVGSQSNYEQEFNEVIEQFYNLTQSQKAGKQGIRDTVLLDLATRVWRLVDEWENQNSSTQESCFRETLLKGVISFMDHESTNVVFRLCRCSIHIFQSLYTNEKQKATSLSQNEAYRLDFSTIFQCLLNTIKVLFNFSKVPKNDTLFKEEMLFEQLINLLRNYIEEGEIFIHATSRKLQRGGRAPVVISNEESVYTLLIYIVGILKNSSCDSSNDKRNLKALADLKCLEILSSLLPNSIIENDPNSEKKAQLYVQITGVLRNLAMDKQLSTRFIESNALVKLVHVVALYCTHEELTLNVVRVLSKLSLSKPCIDQLHSECGELLIRGLWEAMQIHKENTAIMIRITFIYANFTTFFPDIRVQLGRTLETLPFLLESLAFYLQKEIQGETETKPVYQAKSKKHQQFNFGNVEGTLVKVIRLVANLITEQTVGAQLKSHSSQLQKIVKDLCVTVKNKNIEQSEEFVLNGISFLTNLLFYDSPNTTLFQDQTVKANVSSTSETQMLALVFSLLQQTRNEEIKLESLRVLSNLSRSAELHNEFYKLKIHQVLGALLETANRDMQYYTIGVVINLSRSEVLRQGVNEWIRKHIFDECVDKFLNLLEEKNIEDFELCGVALKALINLCQESSKERWSNAQIDRANQVTLYLGEECDSIIDVAKAHQKQIIIGFRQIINAFVNVIPEENFACPQNDCGRKFKTKEELDKHIQRRHK